MNTLKYILLCCVLLWVACDTNKNSTKDNEQNTKDTVTTSGKGEKDSKSASVKSEIQTEKREFKGEGYTISYEVITKGSEVLKNKVHKVLLNALSSEYKSIEDFENALKNKKYAIKSQDCENASREFQATFYQVGEVLDLNISEYSFECGAHGVGSTTVHHFHIESGKEITLEDVIKDKKRFTNQVEKQFCEDNKLNKNPEAYVSAGFENFAGGFFLAKNYLFDKNGITFIYNPYEAGPYTLPPFDVKVSYDKIKPYMLPDNPLHK